MTVATQHKRPMAKVTRPALFARQIQETLSLAALEALLAEASVLHEGQILADGHYFGTAMITLDLATAAEEGLLMRTEPTVPTARRLAAQIATSPAARAEISRMAQKGARGQASKPLQCFECDLRVRAEGLLVFVDVEVEAHLLKRAAGHEGVGR